MCVSLAFDGQDGNGLQLEKNGPNFSNLTPVCRHVIEQFFLFRDFRLPLLDILEKSWMIGNYAQISSGLAKFTSHCLSYSLVFYVSLCLCKLFSFLPYVKLS